MNISKKLSGSELFFDLEGDINSTTAPELDKEVNGSLNGVTKLVLDFKKVDYISSAGLRVLLVAYKTMSKQGTMVVRNVNQSVMDIFSMTGFDSFLTIE